MTTLMRTLSLAAALTLSAAVARAQVSVSLTSSLLVAAPGSTAIFSGTVTNNGATTVFLNGLDGTFGSPNLTLDAGSFLTYAPASLAPGASYTGSFFDVLLSGATGPGLYAGNFRIRGGTTDTANDPLHPLLDIFVQVPEPSALALLALGGVLAWRCRRRV